MENNIEEIADIISKAWLRMTEIPITGETREFGSIQPFSLAIPAPRSDESETGLNDTSPLTKGGSDV